MALIGPLTQILALHDTGARTSERIFTGAPHPMPSRRVFGGQVVAQAVVAAQATIDADRPVHSMHGYFVRPGDVDAPITFGVEGIHDGGSFSTRRVQAYQAGVPIMSMIASFQKTQPGRDSQQPMPRDVPGPDEVVSNDALLASLPDSDYSRWALSRPFDIRHVEGPLFFEDSDRPLEGTQHAWLRAREPLPDDDTLHRAALAYLSDYLILEPIVRKHGAAWTTPGLKAASLDHALWWHRPVRVDQWLLVEYRLVSSGSGRGLANATIFTADGTHVASAAQEGMVRFPEVAP